MQHDENLLKELETKIAKLEWKKEHPNINNYIENIKKGIKISGRTAQLLYPYLLCTSILLSIFKLAGDTPFIRDKNKQYATNIYEINSDGTNCVNTTYRTIPSSNNVINYYSEWHKVEDSLYTREVKKYKIPKYTQEQVLALFDLEEQEFDEILGKPYYSYKEILHNVPENNAALINALIYNQDENNYIYIEETADKNNVSTFSFFLIVLFLTTVISCARNNTSFSYINSINNIKALYESEEIISKKLKISKDNYGKLKG